MMPPKKTEKPNISELPDPENEPEEPVQPGKLEQFEEPKAMPEMAFEGHRLPTEKLEAVAEPLRPRVPALGRMVHFQKGGKRYLAYVAEEPVEPGNPYGPLNLAVYEFRTATWRSEADVPYGEVTDDGEGGLSYPARCWMNPEYVAPAPAILPVGQISPEESLDRFSNNDE